MSTEAPHVIIITSFALEHGGTFDASCLAYDDGTCRVYVKDQLDPTLPIDKPLRYFEDPMEAVRHMADCDVRGTSEPVQIHAKNAKRAFGITLAKLSA